MVDVRAKTEELIACDKWSRTKVLIFETYLSHETSVMQKEAEITSLLEKVRLQEISAGDWARFGVVFGLLWNKLDKVVSNGREGVKNLEYLPDIKRRLDDIANSLRKMSDAAKNIKRR